MAGTRTWVLWALVIGLGVLAVLLRAPVAGWAVQLTTLLLAGAGTWVALRRAGTSPPGRGQPWLLFAMGGLASVAATTLVVIAPGLEGAVWVEAMSSVLVIGLFMVALFWVIRLRTPGQEFEVILDGIAVGLLPLTIAWELILQPAEAMGLAPSEVALALTQIYLCGVLTWMAVAALSRGPRSWSLWLIGASTVGFLVWTILHALVVGETALADVLSREDVGALSIVGGGLAVLAAMHPSWRMVTIRVGPQPPTLSTNRVVLLGMCVAAVPLGLLLGPDGGSNRLFYGSLSLLGLLLIGARAIDLVADRERAVAGYHQAQARLVEQATHDPLTGLPNRAALQAHLQAVLDRRREDGRRCAVLFMDLDDFKLINDSLGHDAGDHVLRAVAERLSAASTGDELVSRFGGDEFVILVPAVAGSTEAVDIAERYRAATEQLERVRGQEVRANVSVGVAVAQGHGVTPESIIRDADAAMYDAKHTEGRIEVFTESQRTRALTQLSVEQGLRRAVREGNLVLRYQPVVALGDGATVGVEALLRWADPRLGLRNPGEFIPVAERSGLIHDLGRWVVGAACEQWRVWQAEGHDVRIGINVAARELVRPGYVDTLAEVIRRHQVPPEHLVLELTERDVLTDRDAIITTLGRLRDSGVRVAVDDFGTGYFSLSQLREIPIDILKIDRAFVADIVTDPAARAIVRACLDLGEGLGLDVVAEGVEEVSQMLLLRDMGCQLAQGFLFTHPVPAEEALRSVADVMDVA